MQFVDQDSGWWSGDREEGFGEAGDVADLALMQEVLWAARRFVAWHRSHPVRPQVGEAVAGAFALRASGWREPAVRLLCRREDLTEPAAEYVLAPTLAESAWRYWLVKAGVMSFTSSTVWKLVVRMDPARLRGLRAEVDLLVLPVCRRLVFSLAEVWDERDGEGAVWVRVPAAVKSRRRRARNSQPGLVDYVRTCLEHMGEAMGWRRIPVVLPDRPLAAVTEGA